MLDILIELAKISPLIAIMTVAIIYFIRKEKGYKEEISDLQKDLRLSEKDSIMSLYKITSLLESVAVKSDMISQEITSLKDYLKERLDRIEKN